MKSIKPILKTRIKYISILMPLVFILIFGVSLRAQESDGGKRVVWSGLVTVDDYETISQRDTLIIEPGTEVDFQSFSLTIYGTLIAKGTLSEQIILGTSNTKSGWKGIKFETTQTKSVLKHCKISGIIPFARSKNKSPENYRNAILIKQATDTILIDRCEFFNNRAGIFITNESKDIIISNSNFFNNTVLDQDIEGIVFVDQNSILQLVGNEFINDTVNTYGVVGMRGASYAFILGNTFKDICFIDEVSAFPYLPVFYSSYGGTMTQNNCWVMGNVFENNFKQDIFLTNTFAFIIKNLFYGNEGSNAKSSAMAAIKSFVKIYRCNFRDYDGSVLLIEDSDVLIEDNGFISNNALTGLDNEIDGGAIRLKGTYLETNHHLIEIINNTFTGNSATNGGVVYSEFENDFCDVFIKHNNFNFNNSSNIVNGGAIYACSTPNLFIENNKFFNNTSQANGGAIHVENSNFTASENVFFNNTAGSNGGAVSCLDNMEDESYFFNFNDNEFYLNSAEIKGGALHCLSDATDTRGQPAELLLYGNSFYFNKTLNNIMGSGGAIAVKLCLLEAGFNQVFYNQSVNGGGLYLKSLFGSTIKDNWLYENNAVNNGGGIYLDDFMFSDDSIKVYDNVISLNHYGQNGGGMFIDSCFNTFFVRNRIDYGFAQPQPGGETNGGGAFINFSSVDFYNNIFANNVTAGENGCISINSITEQNKINFFNCDIFGNADGGGVFIDSEDINSISFINTMFWGNGYGLTFITPFAQSYVASAGYCWFVDGYFNFNIDCVVPTYGISPGVIDVSSNYNLLSYSSCIDKGNPNEIYYDKYFPPSWQGSINDIGATGGPYTVNDSSSKLLVVKSPVPIIVDFTAIPNLFIDNKMVMIHDFSIISSPSDDDVYHWYFGDGNDLVYYAYEHQDFSYQYGANIEQAKITLMIMAGNNIQYLTVEVDLSHSESEKNISQNPGNKLGDTELNVNEVANAPNDQIVVFPNPSSGIINIIHNLPPVAEMNIRIYNTSGQSVLSQVVDFSHSNSISLDITGTLPGIYFIEIKSFENRFLKKIVISK